MGPGICIFASPRGGRCDTEGHVLRNSDILVHTTRTVCPSQNRADFPMPGHWAVSSAFRPSLLPGHTSTVLWESPLLHLQASDKRSHDVQPLLGLLLLRRATRGRCWSSGGLGLAAAAVLQDGQLSCSQACKQLLEGSIFPLCILLSTPPFFPGSALPGLASFPRPQVVLLSLKKSQEFAASALEGSCPTHGESEQCLASEGSQQAEGVGGWFWGSVGPTRQAQIQGRSVRATPAGLHSTVIGK